MFDVSDPKSFEEVTRIRYLISHYHTPEKLEFLKNKVKEKMHFEDKEQKLRTDCWFNPPVILIGNKNDCRTKDPSDSVTTYEAEQKAEELGKLSKIISVERNSFKLSNFRFKPFFPVKPEVQVSKVRKCHKPRVTRGLCVDSRITHSVGQLPV